MDKQRKEKTALRVENLNKYYGSLHALKDVSLYIPRGKVAGLVGPNCAGKTTLIKCVAGLLKYQGELEILEGDVEGSDTSMIGYLGEDEGYYLQSTGEQYLRYFSELYLLDNKKDKIDQKLKTVGLYNKRSEKIKNYSNGMRKRLGIARCLLTDPSLLILDEPLAGLDPIIKQDLMSLISNISKGKRSVLISTHQLRDIEDVCNWLIVLKEGEVAYNGSPIGAMDVVRRSKEIVVNISDIDRVHEMKSIEGVLDIEVDDTSVKLVLDTNIPHVEKDIFKWLLKEEIEFSTANNSLDKTYRGFFGHE